MSNNQTQYSWSSSKVIDDVEFDEKDAELFKKLIGSGDAGDASEGAPLMIPGNIFTGEIVEVTKDFVVVDVGLKSEGLIPASEFDPNEIQLGEKVEVFLDQTEGSDGQIVLSREKARRQRQWQHILKNCVEGSIVRGKVTRKVKGGLMVDIGMEAFLPGSQIDNKRIKNIDEFVGCEYDFVILKINEERKNIVVSRRELLEKERISKKAELLETINEGDLRTGVVKNITDFGVFLDLDGVDGLLHITDMTWKRIKHPSEMVQVGDDVEVIILNVDRDKGRVALGLKQKESNPWEEIEERFPIGTHVKGKIVSLVPYGAFIEIEPGIEGLIHVSEMSWVKNVTDPAEVVQKGDEVEALVLSIQKEEGRISLGIKQLEKNPWEDVEAKYTQGKVVKAQVRSLTNYGAFVELEPGIDGLIHISDMSWTKKISHPSEVFQKGDEVEAVVIAVDRESQKITLSVKQLADNPWENIGKALPISSEVKAKITKTTAFGAYVELENGMDGLIHVTELSDKPFNKVEDVVNIGDVVTARVIEVDPEIKKISLSIKSQLAGVDDDEIVVGKQKKATKKKTDEKGESA